MVSVLFSFPKGSCGEAETPYISHTTCVPLLFSQSRTKLWRGSPLPKFPSHLRAVLVFWGEPHGGPSRPLGIRSKHRCLYTLSLYTLPRNCLPKHCKGDFLVVGAAFRGLEGFLARLEARVLPGCRRFRISYVDIIWRDRCGASYASGSLHCARRDTFEDEIAKLRRQVCLSQVFFPPASCGVHFDFACAASSSSLSSPAIIMNNIAISAPLPSLIIVDSISVLSS